LKNPKSIKFFGGDKTPLPPDTLVAGEVIPWVSFGMLVVFFIHFLLISHFLSFSFSTQHFMMEMENLLKSQF